MKILFVVSAPITATSSANLRNLATIKGFLENNHEVTIVCSHSDDLNDKSKLEFLGISNVKIISLNENNLMKNMSEQVSLSKILNAFRKVYHKFSIFDHYRILTNYVANINLGNDSYDLLISSSDPKSSHLIAAEIKKKYLIGNWVQIYGDPILIDITSDLLLPRLYIKHIEKKLLEMADTIFYVSPITLKYQKTIYSSLSHKMNFIPVPYLVEKKYKTYHQSEGKIIIGYLGDYYSKSRNLSHLHNFVKNEKNYILELVGNTDQEFTQVENIRVQNRLTKDKLKEIEDSVDILITVCNIKGTQIPGKLYHYAGTNKPILVILDGDQSTKEAIFNYLSVYNRFVFCENNVESISNALRNFKQLSKNLDVSPVSELNYRIVSNKIINTIMTN